ncbi:MAG: hypothetical protein V4557_12645 [Bacteroidota bacterium]
MLEKDLKDSIVSDKLSELAADAAELGLDSLLADGVVKDIPVIGSLYKLAKVAMGIRENIFAKKVLKFLIELKGIPGEERKKFIAGLDSDTHKIHKVGEKIIVILERLDDIDKATIVGRLLRAAIKEYIPYEHFLKLSSIVDKAFFTDLQQLKGQSTDNWGIREIYYALGKDSYQHFYNIGIMTMSIKDDESRKGMMQRVSLGAPPKEIGFVPKVEYEFSNLGKELIRFGMNEGHEPSDLDRY